MTFHVQLRDAHPMILDSVEANQNLQQLPPITLCTHRQYAESDSSLTSEKYSSLYVQWSNFIHSHRGHKYEGTVLRLGQY